MNTTNREPRPGTQIVLTAERELIAIDERDRQRTELCDLLRELAVSAEKTEELARLAEARDFACLPTDGLADYAEYIRAKVRNTRRACRLNSDAIIQNVRL